MIGLSASALFCEDIRREGGGRETIIGMMPETIQVSSFPWSIRRVTVHFRIKIQADFVCEKPIQMDIESDSVEIEDTKRDPAPLELIERTIARAKDRGLPYGTIVGRIQMNEPLEFPEPITLFAVLKYGDEKEICGILNVMEKSTNVPTSSA
jgi:hypothetical protein